MAEIEVQKFRVDALPAEEDRVLGAEYWMRNGDGELEVHVVGKESKAVVTATITRAKIAEMITAASSNSASKLSQELTLKSTDLGSDVSVSFTFLGDEGEVTSTVVLKDINDFGVGVQTGTYFKTTVDKKGRVIGGATALTNADLPDDIDGGKIVSEISVDTTGNAATATKLETARTIAGKTFDGTQNVDITAADVGAIALTEIGSTVAPLVNGLIPAANLPTYVDDVIEVSSYNELPGQPGAAGGTPAPEKGKIYLVVENTGTPELPTYTTSVYRWGGSVYVRIIDGVSMADQAMRLADARDIEAGGEGSDGTWKVSFDGSQNAIAPFVLSNTTVTAGDYGFFQVDAKGRLIAARALVLDDIPVGLTHLHVVSAGSIAVKDPAW